MTEVLDIPTEGHRSFADKVAELQTIMRLGTTALDNVVPAFEAATSFNEDGEGLESFFRYRYVADFLVYDFRSRASQCEDPQARQMLLTLADSEDIQTGHRTLTGILKYAPTAYLKLVNSEGRKPDIEELEAGLRGSLDVARLFAVTDRDRSEIFERYFGLMVEPACTGDPFLFTRDGQDKLRLTRNLRVERTVSSQVELIGETDLLDPASRDRRCPAWRIVMDGRWQLAISACVQVPMLFPYDLGRLPLETV